MLIKIASCVHQVLQATPSC